jgi:hypothetical protein
LLPVLVAPAPLLPGEAPPRPHLPRPSAVFLPTFALRICAASCVSPHHSFRHCHIFPPHVIAHHEVAVENCANMCDMRLTVQFCALHSRFGDASPAPFPSTPWPRQPEGAHTTVLRRVNRAYEDSSSAPCYSSLSLADRRAPCMQSLDAPDTAILLSSDRILELFHSSIWPQYRHPTAPAINCTQQFAHPAELSSKTGASRRHTYYASR